MTAAVDHKPTVDQTDAEPVLDVDGMSVEIRTISGTVRAVNEVSFAARRGETLALLGESGCGKSMTATALVGLLEPVADVVVGHREARRRRPVQRRPPRSAGRWRAPTSRSSSRTRSPRSTRSTPWEPNWPNRSGSTTT